MFLRKVLLLEVSVIAACTKSGWLAARDLPGFLAPGLGCMSLL